MGGYRQEGGDDSIAGVVVTKLPEMPARQAEERSGEIPHTLVLQAKGRIVHGGTIGLHAQRN